jgi:hypothetical protein
MFKIAKPIKKLGWGSETTGSPTGVDERITAGSLRTGGGTGWG